MATRHWGSGEATYEDLPDMWLPVEENNHTNSHPQTGDV